MKSLLKRTALFLGVAALVVLAAACAPAPAPAATSVPPTPTPVPPPPTKVPPTTAPAIAPTTAPAVSATTATTAKTTQSGSTTEINGASLYQLSCAACHGANGQGSTFKYKDQTISVPALAWADLKKMYSTNPARGTVEQQFAAAVIKGQDEDGGDLDDMMPRWSSLSQAQVDSLAQFIQSGISGKGAATTLAPAASNLKGEQLYTTACASCHGEDGAGQTFKRKGNSISAASLSWSDLSKMYAEQPSRGTAEQQFAAAVTKGQDEEGDDLNPMMPRWSFLSQAQVDSLVQYIKAAFK